MEKRILGSSTLAVSPICLGTMTFGQQNSEAEAHAQLDRAFAAGINFIDAAEMYPVPPKPETSGMTETIVGNWLARQPRDQVVLATKVAGPGRTLTWIRGGPPALDRANIRAALEGSLRRLRTDYVDLYQLHWPARNQPMFGQWRFNPEHDREGTPIRAQLEVLAELVAAGKIRYVGLSNEHPWGAMQFVRLADEFGLPRVATIQNAVNLLNRTFDPGLAEVCFRERIGLLAYSPLAFGLLSGKYLDDNQAAGRLTRFKGFAQRYDKFGVQPAVDAYCRLARAHGLSPASLALAWVYHHWCVTSTIIGATTMLQLDENLAAWTLGLGDELRQAIDDIHLRHTNPAP